MTFARPDILVKLCDEYAATGNQKLAAARCNVSEPTFYRMLKESAAGKEGYELDYLGEPCKFHDAMKMADAILTQSIAGALTSRSLLGSEEKVYYRGEPSWVMAHDLPLNDPRYIPEKVPEEMLDILYGVHDRFARDPLTQSKIQRTIHHDPPIQGQLAVLAAKLPRTWGNYQRIDVNSRSTGVVTIRDKRQAPTPKPLAASASAPPLAQIVAPPMAAEPMPVQEAQPKLSNDIQATSGHPMPEKPASELPTRSPAATFIDGDGNIAESLPPRVDLSKLSATQLAAREHFEKLAAKKPAHPNPSAKVQVFSPADEPRASPTPAPTAMPVRSAPPPAGGTYQSDDARREGIGNGTVLGGGMKVR